MFTGLKTRLLSLITIYLMIMFTTITVVAYGFYSEEIKDQSDKYFLEKINGTVEQLDNLIYRMDRVSSQLLASTTLQKMFFEASKAAYAEQNYFEHNIDDRKIAQDILWTFNSPKTSVENIHIYTNASYLGLRYNPSVAEVKAYALTNEVVYEAGRSYFLRGAHTDGMDQVNSLKVISLIRPFVATNYGFMDIGVIEVVEKYQDVIDACILGQNEQSLGMAVLDYNGQVIYASDEWIRTTSDEIFEVTRDNEQGHLLTLTMEAQDYRMAYRSLEEYPWYVVLLQSDEAFRQPFRSFMSQLLLGIGALSVLVFVAILLTVGSVTKPIQGLIGEIDGYNLREEPLMAHYQIKEVQTLQSAFIRLMKRLDDSVERLLVARETELNLRVMTLQSQINPHFLYNALNAISSVADDEGDEKVPLMCYQLSELFRYTSSDSEASTTLADEINHIQTYMDFAKWRYEEMFSYSLVCNGDMAKIKVPKLVLQPLVENAFTHAFKKIYPPYNLEISCHVNAKNWCFEVKDNGGGFEAKELKSLLMRMRHIDRILDEQLSYDMIKTDDKAILNIYIRLKLKYKHRLNISLGNRDEKSGAWFRIEVADGLVLEGGQDGD